MTVRCNWAWSMSRPTRWRVATAIPLVCLALATNLPTLHAGVVPESFPLSTQINCPCKDPALCKPVSPPQDKPEFFGFSVNTISNYKLYNYDILTTIAVTADAISDENFGDFLCLAHSHDVRVVGFDGVNIDLSNSTAVSEYVGNTVATVNANNMDGWNLDYEQPVSESSPDRAAMVTLASSLKKALGKGTAGRNHVSFDAAWDAGCIDGRCFDYKGLADACDLLFIMNYDTRSQVPPPSPCTAGPNAAISVTKKGVQSFLDLGISASKLVLGLPWYSYDYPCTSGSVESPDPCPIKSVPFRGCPCSDAAGTQRNFGDIRKQLASGQVRSYFSDEDETPYYSFSDKDGIVHQVWYDDPRSLSAKYSVAKARGLAGVGTWNLDALDYSDSPSAQKDRDDMWRAVKDSL